MRTWIFCPFNLQLIAFHEILTKIIFSRESEQKRNFPTPSSSFLPNCFGWVWENEVTDNTVSIRCDELLLHPADDLLSFNGRTFQLFFRAFIKSSRQVRSLPINNSQTYQNHIEHSLWNSKNWSNFLQLYANRMLSVCTLSHTIYIHLSFSFFSCTICCWAHNSSIIEHIGSRNRSSWWDVNQTMSPSVIGVTSALPVHLRSLALLTQNAKLKIFRPTIFFVIYEHRCTCTHGVFCWLFHAGKMAS